MFQDVSGSVNFSEQELRIGEFWKRAGIYQKSLDQRAGQQPFVFYEGPPTANGMPHPGHCLTRAIKDLFPRYQTMRGRLCQRKAGWDTHGLPVEVEVCKELGIHSKEEIEEFGVEPFIQKCQQSVWRYMQEWERLTQRLGFWVDLESAYVTYHRSYVESVWWSLKQLFDSDLLYQGHKIVWWWAQGGTALSSGEVGQGYRQVADPSVFVRFPLVAANAPLGEHTPSTESLVVWTTTPWTLPSNQFAAVHPDVVYAKVADPDFPNETLILAADLVDPIAAKLKRELTVTETCSGQELVGRRYIPPFDCYFGHLGNQTGELTTGESEQLGWRVVAADFVTTDSGSGVVHQAPAFGEVDYDVLIAEQERFADGTGPDLICAVGPDGKFTEAIPDYQGTWVKDADKPIIRELADRGILYHREQYLHDYPFCWRADEDPLIQFPRRSWFIRTTQFKDEMLANNAKINWLPGHIQEGRFGKFLESNVDWALSRERYWGTPLPIWVCSETGKMEAVASYDELLAKPGATGQQVWENAKRENPELPDDLCIHKPYIDEVTYDSPFVQGGTMQRVPEVIDCWYDSGAMPFAQWGYRGQQDGQGLEQFQSQFPADFISEAIDQTRGWFYSQLAISTLLFGNASREENNGESKQFSTQYPHPFRNCIVLGLMLGEDGQKMSKSKRNYREPQEIFDRYGADALRWYLFANQPPWTSIRYNEQSIKDSIPEFLLRLWNVYSFFVIYARIDGFDPASNIDGNVEQLSPETLSAGTGQRPVAERSELDRWILSELSALSTQVVARMDEYDNYGACQKITEFVDGLSNWYVRRSRERFWASDKTSPDKLDAYWTLYTCLVEMSKIVAPFVPFLAEAFWQNLAGIFGKRAIESVHLCDFPTGDPSLVDEALSQQMSLVREISSLGRSARNNASLKVRQPLAKVEVILADNKHQGWLEGHAELIREELNVKEVEFAADAQNYISYEVVPNFKVLGPQLGKNMPIVKKLLAQADGNELYQQLKGSGHIALQLPDGETVQLDDEAIEIRLQAKEGWAAAQGKGIVVVLATDLTPELLAEGVAKDAIRVIQDSRKETGCEFTDRIRVTVTTGEASLQEALAQFNQMIADETLADQLTCQPDSPPAKSLDVSIGPHPAQVHIEVVK